ncbi:MAG: hypothetical protein LBQ16_05650, partial [Gracilibacteraceae bacterium]|nr:hypothetical protein [Gracilibacteraceae bacterium]
MDVSSVDRALLAEQKQGYLNTGAWEGFHAFILSALAECGAALLPEQAARLAELAEKYGEASPWERRALWSEISREWRDALPAVQTWAAEKRPPAPARPSAPPAAKPAAAPEPAEK